MHNIANCTQTVFELKVRLQAPSLKAQHNAPLVQVQRMVPGKMMAHSHSESVAGMFRGKAYTRSLRISLCGIDACNSMSQFVHVSEGFWLLALLVFSWEASCVVPMAASGSSGPLVFEEAEIGFQGMAEAMEACVSVRARFRKGLPWLQFPIPSKPVEGTESETSPDKPKDVPKNPHAPSTRALELNWEILVAMLTCYSGEFIDIDRLTKEAR